jgi:RNA polymerase sigma-70 factor (ECF subfamily)
MNEEVKDDGALVRRTLAGDKDAFSILATQYERKLVAVAQRILNDIHASEDVAQSSLLQAYRKLDRLESSESFGGWIFKIAYREALRILRDRPRNQVEIVLELVPDASLSPADIASRKEIVEIMKTAIELLPQTDREVLQHLLRGASEEEIATRLGITLNALYARTCRARKALREALGKLGLEL